MFEAAAPRWMRYELPAVLLIAWLVFISIPLSLGYIGLSWDALNHHIYLGWTAEQQRFDRDFWAASSQSYQFPYLYWPVYKMAVSGFSGAAAGVVLASLDLFAVPPVWMLSRVCIPGPGVFEMLLRVTAVIMAFMTGVVMSLFDSTSNDLLAAVPLLWAIALAFWPLRISNKTKKSPALRYVVLSGLLAGASVAFKLSNGPVALLMPLLWLLHGNGLWQRLKWTALGCVTTLIGCSMVYSPWGWQLWQHFGNPIYPQFDAAFESLRVASGWRP